MAGLSHLRDVYEKRGKEFLENLLTKNVIINEKEEGAYFGAKLDPNTKQFNFFKKDSKLGYVDRVLSRYYEPAISCFENLNPSVKSAIPDNFVFGMNYNPSRNPSLTINHIKVLDDNYQTAETIHEKATLDKWANAIGINQSPVIFQGKLTDEQQIKIQEFIFTPLAELTEKFKTKSFTKHILSVLNPITDESLLAGSPERDIEEIVFRFYGEDSNDEPVYLAKIVDPVFYSNAQTIPQNKNKGKSDDYVWIIVIDLMNFIERYRLSDLRGFNISGQGPEEKYLNLINYLFVEFIKEYGDKYIDLDIQVPEFLTKPEFDVNSDLIDNQIVVDTIGANPNYKEIYRIFVNIFRKKKTKVNSSLFTDAMKFNLNAQIEKLTKLANEEQVLESYFPSFSEFVGDEAEPGYFETYETENDAKSRVKRVNLLISEFQPISNWHTKHAKLLTNKNGVPTLLVCVHPGKTSKKFPFKKETLVNALSKLSNSDPQNIAGYIVIGDGNVESILKAIKPQYEPLIIAADPSRIKDIALQMELARKRSRNLNIKRNTSLIELPSSQIDDSLINSIKSRDFSKYKEFTPSQIHADFYNLNKDLNESTSEVTSINEAIVIEIPKPPVDPIITID